MYFFMPSLLFQTGCMIVPPTRVTTAIKTASGNSEKLAPEPPVIGKTPRSEVEERYHAFAVDTGGLNLFWGRYLQSQWYQATYPIGAGRIWKTENILITFDDLGIVKTFETIPDKELINRLASMQKAGVFPLLNLSKPVRVDCMVGYPLKPWSFELSSAGLTVETPIPATYVPRSGREPGLFFVPSSQVVDMAASDAGSFIGQEFMTTNESIYLLFSEKTSIGKGFGFYVKQGDVLTLVRWLGQTKGARP